MIEYLLAGAAGFGLGVLAERYKPRDRPLRLVKRFALQNIPIAATDPEELAEWELNLVTFAWWGDQCSFSNRTMCFGWKVCSDPGWTVYMKLLADMGAIVRQERRPTRWAPGWGVRHLRLMLKHGCISPPYPASRPPFVGSTRAAPQMTQPNTAPQG